MTTNFPSPIGGVALSSDLAPSIIFAIIYAILVPFNIYRLFFRKSRTIMVFGTFLFVIERSVIFSIRAAQAHGTLRPDSHKLATYMQITIGVGFFTMIDDFIKLFRCLLVNATKPVRPPQSQALTDVHEDLETNPTREDRPKERAAYRNFFNFASLWTLTGSLPGIYAGAKYIGSMTNIEKGKKVVQLRGLLGVKSVRNINRRSTLLLATFGALLTIVPLYRLTLIHYTTSSLTASSPFSTLNTSGGKATFYIFHMMPEVIVATCISVLNIRDIFGTGFWGDWRSEDVTPIDRWMEKRRAKRESEGTVNGGAYDAEA
ncbi:hypothetical protein JAAARDRAFT_187527 [Jaapia argillacea MUCL 33604]|uniref:Uncharacterized protein n=1 Tax=Jaapia argillacea MUCL 33604 TaxID=933084 RepID=A0A067QNE8_9AGAM|nr:hypothetical protein JAAARDRAFT_187527 [Jaapia argillacea MUCL 33604]